MEDDRNNLERDKSRNHAGLGAESDDPDPAPWAARLHPDHAPAAAAMRLTPDVRACLADNHLWLRGDLLTKSIADQLARLAPDARYTVSVDGALTPHAHRLPQGHLPDVTWVRVQEVFDILIPRATFPASPPPRLPLRLVPSTDERPAIILLTTLSTLATYADTAPAVRLNRLRLAASNTDAILQGTPLPPLPGTRFTTQSNIATPCGHTWHPPIDAASLSRLLSLNPGDLALLNIDGTHQQIPADAFVRATRSAVRLTLQSIGEVAR